MTREPVSEHYSSGPLGPRVSAALAAAGLDQPGHLLTMTDTVTELERAGFEALDAVDRTAWSRDWFVAQAGGPSPPGRSVELLTFSASDPPPLGLQVVMGQRFAAMGLNLMMNMIGGECDH